jgi:SAM-dependent methyltransferase
MTTPDVVRAYDAVARGYDSEVLGDRWVREVLWSHYRRVFVRGQHVLDIACGTGTDALFLAQHGIRVTAIDSSPEMLAQLQAKIRAAGREDLIAAELRPIGALSDWPAERFDGAISAFAGLNAVPDLTQFASDAARLLRRGGRLVVHMLNRFNNWEFLGLLARRRWREARALGRQNQRSFVIGGVPVPHAVFSPSEAYARFFAPHFRVRQAYSLGALCPPPSARRVPRPAAQLLCRLEPRVRAARPFLEWGRFYVLDLEKRL